jgi:hypothetical protein
MDEIIEERREIEDFVSIISRVGGFLAFFKISAILFILHQYLYERKVVADMKGGAKSSEKEQKYKSNHEIQTLNTTSSDALLTTNNS